MISYLLKDFARSKSLVTGVALLSITGLISIYIGGLFLDKQAETATQAATTQRESLERTREFVADDDLGLFLYYARFGLVNETPRLAGLSIGQRDVHPTAQTVNVRNLEEQRHVSTLRNPAYQLLGNLDFGFVLIFLFPLVVIALCFNLWSEEREGGTWAVVLSQAERPGRVLHRKLLLRFAAVQLTLLALLTVAKVYLGIPLDAHFALFGAVAVAYVTFWFCLAWAVVRRGGSSSRNALSLLVAWIALLVVAPSALQAAVAGLYPTPEAYAATLEGRDGYHDKWDEPVAPTLAAFREVYPQFAAYEHPAGEPFSWLWYYAMQHLGDVEAAGSTRELRRKLTQRDAFSKTAGYLLPSVHAQLTLNALGRSDLANYLAFQDRLAEFHEGKRLGFYPSVFAGEPVSAIEWDDYAVEYFRDARRADWLAALLPLVGACVLLIAGARVAGAPYASSSGDTLQSSVRID